MPTLFRPATSPCRNRRASPSALRKRPDPKALTKLAEAWRPWRGVAAHLLWAYYHAVKRREGISLEPATQTKKRAKTSKKAKKKTKKRKTRNG